MTLENKVKGAFKERVYNQVDPSTGIRYVVRKPSLVKRLSNAILGGVLGFMPIGCGGGGGSSGSGSNPIDTPPTITSTPVTTATENWPIYAYDVDATDPDVGDTLTYSLVTAPLGASINTSSGLINWTAPDKGGTNYSENFVVQVSDGTPGNEVQQGWTVNVTNTGAVTVDLRDFFNNGLTGLDAMIYDATNSFQTFNTSNNIMETLLAA